MNLRVIMWLGNSKTLYLMWRWMRYMLQLRNMQGRTHFEAYQQVGWIPTSLLFTSGECHTLIMPRIVRQGIISLGMLYFFTKKSPILFSNTSARIHIFSCEESIWCPPILKLKSSDSSLPSSCVIVISLGCWTLELLREMQSKDKPRLHICHNLYSTQQQK